MPPTLPAAKHRMFAAIGSSMNQQQAMATQQQNDWATSDGQVVMRTGVLFQYPTSGTNYSSGVGQEVLQDGSGGPPVMRMGQITWTSPSGGTVTIYGQAFMDSNGLVRAVLDDHGLRTYDTSGNLATTIFSY